MVEEISIAPGESPKSLANVLKKRFPIGYVRKVFRKHGVRLNGKRCKPDALVHPGDRIELYIPFEKGPRAPRQSGAPTELDIIYEDESLIVVNKPAGLVVHPAAGIQTGTLANGLAFHFDRLSTKAGAIRPGIVHRIDKDTSGLLVVAKTEPAHENLADQFRDRTVFKSYLALVHGVVEQDSGRIEQPLARDPRNRTRIAIVRGGRSA